jgi:hypothetical protein
MLTFLAARPRAQPGAGAPPSALTMYLRRPPPTTWRVPRSGANRPEVRNPDKVTPASERAHP